MFIHRGCAYHPASTAQVLAACFNDAAELLWGLITAQEAAQAAPQPAAATGAGCADGRVNPVFFSMDC
jgi:hypothetical protein